MYWNFQNTYASSSILRSGILCSTKALQDSCSMRTSFSVCSIRWNKINYYKTYIWVSDVISNSKRGNQVFYKKLLYWREKYGFGPIVKLFVLISWFIFIFVKANILGKRNFISATRWCCYIISASATVWTQYGFSKVKYVATNLINVFFVTLISCDNIAYIVPS